MIKINFNKLKKIVGKLLLVPILLVTGSKIAGASQVVEEGVKRKQKSVASSGAEKNSEAGFARKNVGTTGKVESGLSEYAKNLDYLNFSLRKAKERKDETLVQSFLEGVTFMKSMGIDGAGAGLVVLDSGFEPDSSVQFSSNSQFVESKNLKNNEVEHGTIVAATAASTHEKSVAIASGAAVYINECQVFYKTSEQNSLIEEKEKQLFAIRDAFSNDVEGPYVKNNKVLSNKAKQYRDAGNLVELKKVEDEQEKSIKEHQQRYNEYGLITTPLIAEIARLKKDEKNLFDRLEETIESCIANNQPIPHVVNISLEIKFNKSKANLIKASLDRLFKKYDLLLVIAAGNDGGSIGEKARNTQGLFSLKQMILDNPEIQEKIMFVTASDIDKQAGFSTRAGVAKDHSLTTFGFAFDTSTYAADGSVLKKGDFVGGTSFSAPRVSAVAVVLKKYFPELSMDQIKKIILDTAEQSEGRSQDELGRGLLNPLAAWAKAVEMTTPVVPAPVLVPVVESVLNPTGADPVSATVSVEKKKGFFARIFSRK